MQNCQDQRRGMWSRQAEEVVTPGRPDAQAGKYLAQLLEHATTLRDVFGRVVEQGKVGTPLRGTPGLLGVAGNLAQIRCSAVRQDIEPSIQVGSLAPDAWSTTSVML